jgi:hypothetical protein
MLFPRTTMRRISVIRTVGTVRSWQGRSLTIHQRTRRLRFTRRRGPGGAVSRGPRRR